MDELAKLAKSAEDLLLGLILEFFKRNPNTCFTASGIVNELGLTSDENYRYSHGLLNILKEQGRIVKVEPGNGFKYKN